MKMDNEELIKLLNIANDLRSIKGDKLLDDLPLADPEDVYSCLVANAFNYGCTVDPSITQEGTIQFDSADDLESYLKVVDDAVEVESDEIGEFKASLPNWVNQIALDFDEHVYQVYEAWRYDENGHYMTDEELDIYW